MKIFVGSRTHLLLNFPSIELAAVLRTHSFILFPCFGFFELSGPSEVLDTLEQLFSAFLPELNRISDNENQIIIRFSEFDSHNKIKK
jgi:hypothetical protein